MDPQSDQVAFTPNIILIGGETCSGKTTLCNQLVDYFSKIGRKGAVIEKFSLDNFYLGNENPEENPHKNYDEPAAIDFPLVNKIVDELLAGNSVNIPVYDFCTHSRTEETIKINPSPIILIEGIFVFNNEELVKKARTKVIVECNEVEVICRRFSRDTRERGRDAESIGKQLIEQVFPGKKLYIIPTRDKADIVINNNAHNKFQGLEILLPYILTLLLTKDQREYMEGLIFQN